ncbi:hypothetical protein [Pinirhizobacter soli]|nr:hypothetical protein [Pinirhizobacter soli]
MSERMILMPSDDVASWLAATPLAKAQAPLSLALWLAVICCGRLLAYV